MYVCPSGSVSLKLAVVSVHGCPCIPPGGQDAGGMNVYVRETSLKLAELGHELTVFARHHAVEKGGPSPFSRCVELVHIPAGEIKITKDQVGETLLEFVTNVRKWIANRRTSFDAIAAHYWFSGVVGASLAKELALPLVFSYHTMAATKQQARTLENESTERLEAEREIAQHAERIVAWTAEESATVQRVHSVPADRVVVSSPGVDCTRFAPKSGRRARTALGLPFDGLNVLYVGRLDAFKGIDLLLAAFARIAEGEPSARLIVAGDGDDEQRSRLRFGSEALGVSGSIHWLGVVPHEEMPSLYASADVMLAPSYHETFGLAALEAAASGVPVVAADVDGLRAIVVDGLTGYLVRDRDADEYASRTLDLLRNDSLRLEMSENGRRRAELRSWDAVAKDLEEIYAGAIGS